MVETPGTKVALEPGMKRRSVRPLTSTIASLIVGLMLALHVPSRSLAQRPDGAGQDPVSREAAGLLNTGRGNEARILLQRNVRSATSPSLRALYRLRIGDTYLHDGLLPEAIRVYDAVLSSDDARGVDSLTSWAHRGLGLAEAFSGRRTQAATHFAEAFKTPSDPRYALSDSIDMLVATGQYDAADKALDRMEATVTDADGQQYVQSFRALNTVLSGHCTAALETLQKVPDQNRPMPRAVRGRCASKRGHKQEAMALRDSVLKQPMADPFSWRMLIVRDAARAIR